MKIAEWCELFHLAEVLFVLIPTEFNGVSVLVETLPPVGTEPTGARRPAERVQEMFADAQLVIEGVALSVMESGRRVAAKAGSPDQLEIQFGIKFSANGSIVIAGASSEASLSVKVVYGVNRFAEEIQSETAASSGASQAEV